MNEFSLIKHYFIEQFKDIRSKDIKLINGDDAAILRWSNDDLVTCIDAINVGVHFPSDTPPDAVAHKALAVNLSDLASMGAKPHSFTMALSLPEANKAYLKKFSHALKSLAKTYRMPLISGDLARGALSVCIQINGCLPTNKALRRDQAKVDDDIYVSSYLGLAALALFQWQNKLPTTPAATQRFYYPEPRVELGLALLEIGVKCAIDISDGLLNDLQHILTASDVGADIGLESIPLHSELMDLDEDHKNMFILNGGDDYELCFTASVNLRSKLDELSRRFQIARIGQCTDDARAIQINNKFGKPINIEAKGYRHF